MTAIRWFTGALLAFLVALAARRMRALTWDGAAAAALMGTVVMSRGGPAAGLTLVQFFCAASALSRFKKRRKETRGVIAAAKGAERDAWQVCANGAAAAVAIGVSPSGGAGVFIGGVAAAAADTWGTELGLLSIEPPRLITSGQRVAPGTSGAVTATGLAAGLLGAAATGATWSLTARRAREMTPRHALTVAVIAGGIGTLVDSLLGATIQARYWCPRCAAIIEEPVHSSCGAEGRRAGGVEWVTNDVVNALGCATGACAGGLLDLLLLSS